MWRLGHIGIVHRDISGRQADGDDHVSELQSTLARLYAHMHIMHSNRAHIMRAARQVGTTSAVPAPSALCLRLWTWYNSCATATRYLQCLCWLLAASQILANWRKTKFGFHQGCGSVYKKFNLFADRVAMTGAWQLDKLAWSVPVTITCNACSINSVQACSSLSAFLHTPSHA